MPQLLRDAGLRLVTLAERYGIPADEGIADAVWLAEAGRRGECVFLKDGRVRYNTAEKAATVKHEVRCFCLARRDLDAVTMAERFLTNLDRIADACADGGGALYLIHPGRIERMALVRE